MTQDQWNTCCDPAELLAFLRKSGKLSERKLRLFAVACCRSIWHLLEDERSRKAVEVAVQYADGLASDEELLSAATLAYAAAIEERAFDADGTAAPEHAALYAIGVLHANGSISTVEPSFDVVNVALNAAAAKANRATLEAAGSSWEVVLNAELAVHAQLLRDIFGNPFRAPAPMPASLLTASSSEPILHLAQIAYDERQLPQGTLVPARLAALADALEEAACRDADLVGHLRSDGPHVRGCYALDAVLGKG